MKMHIRLGFAFLASLCLCATSVTAQEDPAAVVQGLESADREEQWAALRALRGVAPDDIGPAVRQALIEATLRENRAEAERMERIRTLRDPETIPALLGMFAGGVGGRMLTQGLAEFAELAAGPTLDAVMDPASNRHLVNGGLGALRFIVELTPGLSPATLEAMTLAAEHHLMAPGAGSAVVLLRAIDLATVLADPRLDDILRSLVSDLAAVEASVSFGTSQIERIQERAQQALARVPPNPRPR